MSSSSVARQVERSGFDPIKAAHSVVPALAQAASATEDKRQVDQSAITALRESGLSRMLTPRSHGGYELSPSAHIRSCLITAEGCSAASWVHMVCGAHTFVLGRYPEKCQREIFDGNPDVLIPGTLAPQRTVAVRQRRRSRGLAAAGRTGLGCKRKRCIAAHSCFRAEERHRSSRYLAHPGHARYRFQGSCRAGRICPRTLRYGHSADVQR